MSNRDPGKKTTRLTRSSRDPASQEMSFKKTLSQKSLGMKEWHTEQKKNMEEMEKREPRSGDPKL